MGSDKKKDPVGRRLGLKGVHLVDVVFLQRDLFFFNELIMIIYIYKYMVDVLIFGIYIYILVYTIYILYNCGWF